MQNLSVVLLCKFWKLKFSALLAFSAGNSLVTGEFPAQRPVTRSCDVFFDLRLNKRLSKQSWDWWFETPSCSLWRQCNVWCLPSTDCYFNVAGFFFHLFCTPIFPMHFNISPMPGHVINIVNYSLLFACDVEITLWCMAHAGIKRDLDIHIDGTMVYE